MTIALQTHAISPAPAPSRSDADAAARRVLALTAFGQLNRIRPTVDMIDVWSAVGSLLADIAAELIYEDIERSDYFDSLARHARRTERQLRKRVVDATCTEVA